jgi:hypothetical protein
MNSPPLDLLVGVYSSPRFPLDRRTSAAAMAARFQLPSLSARAAGG